MNLLSKYNIQAHKDRPCTPPDKKVTLWRASNHFLHCCVESRGCRLNRDLGACIMCDYGIGRNLTPEELRTELYRLLPAFQGQINTLLIGTYGSVFDQNEVSSDCFEVILNFLKNYKVSNVIFETHCSTVTSETLNNISKNLPDKNIIIEMGFESSDEYILKNCLNKFLELDQLISVIDLIHQFSMEVCLNVFLGAPFLCEFDQLDSAVESVNWAFEHGADSVVIFPANIKPFTLLYRLYKEGRYHSISQWMVVELLSRVPKEKLNRVTLSWYGDRENFYDNHQYALIPPQDCPKCHNKIFDFYRKFMDTSDIEKRERLLSSIRSERQECECRNRFLHSLCEHEKKLEKGQIEGL